MTRLSIILQNGGTKRGCSSMLAFQQAKESGKTTCCKCFEEDGIVNFFLEGAGLSQHFRAMHSNVAVDSAKSLEGNSHITEDGHGRRKF